MQEYDWDIYEMFKEQLDNQLPQIESYTLLLSKEKSIKDSLDELFRFYHTYKASSAYLGLTPITKLVSKAETVLSSLRDSPESVSESIIEWLLLVGDQMYKYSLEMESRKTILTPLDESFLKKVKITSPTTKPGDKLKTLSLVYVDAHLKRTAKILPALKHYTRNVTHVVDVTENLDDLKLDTQHILVCFLKDGDFGLIDFIQQHYPYLPMIPIYSTIDYLSTKELLKRGISHAVEAPINIKKIERELLSTVKSFYLSSTLIISHKKITQFIQTLKPLPNTVFQIIQICDDEEMSIKELIKVVKTDPIIAANILKVANSPVYGSVELKTIDSAVSKFGKRSIKALTLSGMSTSLGDIDLSAYGISEDTFSTISSTRMSLMVSWYSKVSISELSLLSTVAILSNIGQLLISKELIAINKDDIFQELTQSFDIKYAEENILHTNTNNVSAEIIRFWKLDPEIVDVIEYSDKPHSAPEHIKKLCAAAYIVNNLVTLNAKVAKKIPDGLLPLLAEHNFDPEPLNKALASL